jgi:anaerobic ribonucleoside-triphosphate reductase activating protein
VLWVQGCSRHCPGCFNPLTHSREGGFELPAADIMRQIPYKKIEGITVSGGEPFEQPEELLTLLDLTKAAGLNRLVYTGFTYEELFDKRDATIGRILSLTDILIDGAYEEGRPAHAPWAGSVNQRVLELKDGKIRGFYHFREEEQKPEEAEILIDKEGCLLVTGIVNGAFFREGTANV